MKYYSEITKKTYDTEDECQKEELKFKEEKDKVQKQLDKALKEREEKEKVKEASKKELAKKIEEAEQEVTEANNLYETAKEKAKAILDEAKAKANTILDTAKEKVKEAQEKKYNAVAEFNKQFGPYTTTLTSAQAAQVYNDTIRKINDFWNSFWRF